MPDKYHVIWDREARRYEVRHARLFVNGMTYVREGRVSVCGGVEFKLADMAKLDEDTRWGVKRIIVDEIDGYAAACTAASLAPSGGPRT